MGHFECNSCQAKIPPEWVNAIQSNTCPGCGGSIMDEDTVTLMKGITEAMEQMPNDPQGIAGWILANYRLEKVGDGEPTGFHRIRPVQQISSVTGQYTDDKTAKLHEFFKRADAPAEIIGMTKEDLQRQKQKQREDQGDIIEDSPAELIDVNDPSQIDPAYANVNVSAMITEDEIEAIRAKAAARTERKNIPSPVRNISTIDDLEYSKLEVDEKMSPELRAELEKRMYTQMKSRDNVLSGVRVGKNGFTRGS